MAQIGLLMTGNELVNGDIVDTNSAWLAAELNQRGFSVKTLMTVGDSLSQLVPAIASLSAQLDVLLINGGLGPTLDDLSAEAIALAANVELELNPNAKQHLESWSKTLNIKLDARQYKQCMLPQGAQIFTASPGSACAFFLTIGNCLVIATPGVPWELKHIFKHAIIASLSQHDILPDSSAWQRYPLFGLSESYVQGVIEQQFPTLLTDYEIGFRAQLGQVELKMRPKAELAQAQQQQAEQACTALLAQLNEYLLFFDGQQQQLSEALLSSLIRHNSSVAFAESCTGGLMASQMTALAGASKAFKGAIVCYDNSVKTHQLGVTSAILAQHGAVSEVCAKQMLHGLLHNINAEYGVAVTGIAGPSGGSTEKPVGTVFIAYGSRQTQTVLALHIPQQRQVFQQLVCNIGFDCLRRMLSGFSLQPRYLKRYQIESAA